MVMNRKWIKAIWKHYFRARKNSELIRTSFKHCLLATLLLTFDRIADAHALEEHFSGHYLAWHEYAKFDWTYVKLDNYKVYIGWI